MSGGSKTTNSTSTQEATSKNTIDPQQYQMLMDNYASAQQNADTLTPYTGTMVAPENPYLTQGYNGLLDVAGSNTGTTTQARDALSGILQYKPQSITAPTAAVPGLVTAYSVSSNPIIADLLKNVNLQDYMNPYQNEVIDRSMADYQRARDIQQVNDNQSATASKAFGGARQGVADSLTNDAFLRASGTAASNLRASGYENAQRSALQDIANKFGADQFNSSQKFAADSANAQGQFNADAFNAGMLGDFNKFNAANQMDAAKTNATNELNAMQTQLQASQQMMQLSDQELAQAIQKAGLSISVGEARQQLEQDMYIAQYQEFLRQQGFGEREQQMLNAALGLVPAQQTITSSGSGTGTQTEKSSVGLGQILLAGIGAAGAAAAGGAFSDRRLKKDIAQVGKTPGGLNVYSFKYLWNDEPQIGVMADEVEKVIPSAVLAGPCGFKMVDYSQVV